MQAIARRAAAPIFVLALFSSAALIFVLQPLFGRMATPLLGGSPSVWNTSMAFFQAALLIGYLYAHLLARVKDLRLQAAIHAVVLAAAFFVLPVHVSDALGAPSSEHPALWLVGVLALSVGAPFAAASATAPLLQSWYARTGRADAHDPYYLYAASNLGSFIGLLAYPTLIEPLLGLSAQSVAWTIGYVVAAGLIVLCAITAIGARGAAPEVPAHAEAPTWKQRFYWMGAAAVPSALILGVTLHISTDVASAPMLWVVPLALYLATFVIAFAKGSERIAPFVIFVQPVALGLLVFSYFSLRDWAWTLSGNLIGFFFSALVCHLALARTRPHAGRLTEFYFWVSLGGVLGGAFAAFLAPVIFNDVYEYPLALAAAALFRPRGAGGVLAHTRLGNVTAAAAVTMAVIAAILLEYAPLDVVVAAAMAGGAMAAVAAGWDDAQPLKMRVAFLLSATAASGIAFAMAMQKDKVFLGSIVDNTARMHIQSPWNGLLLAACFLPLVFIMQAAVRPSRPVLNDEEEGEAGAPRASSFLSRWPVADVALGVALPCLLLGVALVLMRHQLDARNIAIFGLGFCGVALFFNGARPLMLAVLVLTSFATILLEDYRDGRIITQERSFFGVLRTRALEATGELRILMHGTTIHGAQLTAPGLTRLPLTYYNPNTALGEAILGGLNAGETSHLALIGLGAGSTACLMRPTDQLTIYEIDPSVVRLSAQPGGDFTFVPECQPNARVELGDARLRIADAPDGTYDVIVVDAFSSDAIPAHLLTREAIALYLSKLTERGIVVLHLSNRNLALVSEARRVAESLNAPTLFRISDRINAEHASFYGGLPASVMIVARNPQALALLPLTHRADWRVLDAPPGRAWSDDYINLPRALYESLSGAEQCRLYPYLSRCEGEAAAAPAKD